MALPQRQQQAQRFSYRPLVGQGESHRFGEAALIHSAPVLTHTDVDRAAAALSEWVESAPCCGLIDLRPEADFAGSHLAGSTSLPWGDDISGGDFIARAHELPERGATLALLADNAAVAAAAADHMRRAGYVIQFTVALSAAELARVAWPVSPGASVASSRQLWKPSPCLQEVIEPIERQLAVHAGSKNTALDLGCGTGRDCIFLAKRGFAVTGVDYLEKQLVRARDLASRCDVAQSCTFLEVDACTGAPATWVPANPASIVHVGRFLHRPLLPILRDQCVAPGGFIVYHTFMVGCEAFGRPRKPEHLLRDGELRKVFAGWHVLVDDVRPCSDGRPLSWFAARKPLDEESHIPKETADYDDASSSTIKVQAPSASGPGTKRKYPERSNRQQRKAEAAKLSRRFEYFYQGVGRGIAEHWDDFERSLLTPHRGFCFRVCGGTAAATATGRELLETFGNLILPVKAAADTPGLRRLEWTADGGRSWRLAATRSELQSDPQLRTFRDWVIARQRTGQVRREDLADMLPVVALLRQSLAGSVVERVLDLCAAPPHLAPGVGTGRLLDSLWDGGDFSAGTAAGPSYHTPQAKRLLVSNEPELSRCWMVLQEAGLPDSRRSLSPVVLCACQPEAFPIPPTSGTFSVFVRCIMFVLLLNPTLWIQESILECADVSTSLWWTGRIRSGALASTVLCGRTVSQEWRWFLSLS